MFDGCAGVAGGRPAARTKDGAGAVEESADISAKGSVSVGGAGFTWVYVGGSGSRSDAVGDWVGVSEGRVVVIGGSAEVARYCADVAGGS